MATPLSSETDLFAYAKLRAMCPRESHLTAKSAATTLIRDTATDDNSLQLIQNVLRGTTYSFDETITSKYGLKGSIVIVDYEVIANFNTQFGPQKITPLIALILKGHTEAVKLLLENECVNPDLAARHNMTPLHFAALTNNLAIQRLLIMQGANPKVLNAWNGSARHIREVCHPGLAAPNRFGYRELVFPYTSPSLYLRQWTQDVPEELPIDRALRNCIGDRWKPTSLTPYHHSDTVGVAIRTDESIEPGRIIAFYAGQLTLRGRVDNVHQMRMQDPSDETLVIDGETLGSHATRFCDGFPSLIQAWIRNFRGMTRVHAFISAEEIRAGSTLCMNYRGQTVTKHHPDYVEIAPDALRRWVKGFDQRHYLRVNALPYRSLKDFYVRSLDEQRLLYLIDTPLVYLTLVTEGLIDQAFHSFILSVIIDPESKNSKSISHCIFCVGMLLDGAATLQGRAITPEEIKVVYRTLYDAVDGDLATKKFSSLIDLLTYPANSSQIEEAMARGCPSRIEAICALIEMCGKKAESK